MIHFVSFTCFETFHILFVLANFTYTLFFFFSLCSVRDCKHHNVFSRILALYYIIIYVLCVFCRFIKKKKKEKKNQKNVHRGEKQDCENKLLMIQQPYLSTHWSLKIKWRVIGSMLLNFPFNLWALSTQHIHSIAKPSIFDAHIYIPC